MTYKHKQWQIRPHDWQRHETVLALVALILLTIGLVLALVRDYRNGAGMFGKCLTRKSGSVSVVETIGIGC